MKITANDLMVTPSATLHPDMYLPEAFKAFHKAFAIEGEVFGLVVVDEQGDLVGILSMYDVFLLFLPKNIHLWGAMEDIDFQELSDTTNDQVKSVKVSEVMSKDPVAITPETPLVSMLDIIVKKHIRRIPVVSGGKMVGLVYAANVFYHLMDQVIEN